MAVEPHTFIINPVRARHRGLDDFGFSRIGCRDASPLPIHPPNPPIPQSPIHPHTLIMVRLGMGNQGMGLF
jgi:hypothetical protein